MYVHNKLKKYVTFIKNTSDCIMWIKLDGKLFNLNNNLLLCLVYNAPQGSGREYLSENNAFELISDDILHFKNEYEYENCEFLICGDFNARVGERPDFVLNDTVHVCVENL